MKIRNLSTNSKNVKTLCSECAGVINGDVTNSETGEFPCYCNKKLKSRRNADKSKFWRNGRQRHNTQQL